MLNKSSFKEKSKSKKSRTLTSVHTMRSYKNRNKVERSLLSANNVSIQEHSSKRSFLNNSFDTQYEASSSKKISIPSAVFTMFIGIVGAGCLSLPYAMRKTGLIVGVILIVVAPILSYFTLDLLIISCEYLPKNVAPSYQALTEQSLGIRSTKILQYLMLLMYFGALAGYVVAWSGLIDLVWQVVSDGKSIYMWVVIGVSYGITFPLSLLRNLSALQYTSCFGAICAIYLTIVVVTDYFLLCHEADITKSYTNTCFWKEPKVEFGRKILQPFDSFNDGYQGFLTAFPLIVFAYTGHMYILPVYVRLKNKSVKRMRIVFKAGNTFIFLLYIFIASFGFFLFLKDVCGNLLLNKFEKMNDIIIAACGVAASCICTSPLHVYNFRRIFAVIVWKQTPEELALIKHIIIAVLFVTVNVVVGLYVKSITVVFGCLGATMYPFMGYILPAVYFCKMVPNDKYIIRKFFAIFQAIIMSVICIAAFIWSFFQEGSDSNCDNAQTIG